MLTRQRLQAEVGTWEVIGVGGGRGGGEGR